MRDELFSVENEKGSTSICLPPSEKVTSESQDDWKTGNIGEINQYVMC